MVDPDSAPSRKVRIRLMGADHALVVIGGKDASALTIEKEVDRWGVGIAGQHLRDPQGEGGLRVLPRKDYELGAEDVVGQRVGREGNADLTGPCRSDPNQPEQYEYDMGTSEKHGRA